MSFPPAPPRWTARSSGAAETAAIGAALGRTAPDGAVILLDGPLGAGKTTFAQGVATGCGVAGPVTSPTYNLVLRYPGTRPFTHVDLYRLDREAALRDLGLEEVLGVQGVACVEWPALAESIVDPPWARVRIGLDGASDAGRTIEVAFAGAGWERARAALEALRGADP